MGVKDFALLLIGFVVGVVATLYVTDPYGIGPEECGILLIALVGAAFVAAISRLDSENHPN